MTATFFTVTIVIIIIVVILTAPWNPGHFASQGWSCRDSLAQIRDVLGNLGRMATLGDRTELLVKLIKSFVSGNCHPAMKLLVQQKAHGALSVPQSRTVLGNKTFICDWCYYIQPMVCLLLRLRGIMIPVSGPGTRSWKCLVIEYFENLHHQLYTLQSGTVNRVD